VNKKLSSSNIPSAPPFVGSEPEIDQILTREAHGTSRLANPSGSATTKESRSTASSGIYNQSARFVHLRFVSLSFLQLVVDNLSLSITGTLLVLKLMQFLHLLAFPHFKQGC